MVSAPDPLTLRGQDIVFGFDEFSVFKELLSVVLKNEKLFFIVKIHPLQENKDLFFELKGSIDRVFIDSANVLTNLETIFYSDFVVGFYSNFLLEASMLEKTVFRYFPQNAEKDILSYLDFGQKINNIKTLNEQINFILA